MARRSPPASAAPSGEKKLVRVMRPSRCERSFARSLSEYFGPKTGPERDLCSMVHSDGASLFLVVEELISNQQVSGSIPLVGSRRSLT